MLARVALWASCVLMFTPVAAQSAEPSPGALLRRVSALRFEVAGGRITCPTLSRAASRTLSADEAEIKETLSINLGGDEPFLSNRYVSPSRQWSLEFHGSDMKLSDKSDTELIQYEQFADRPVKLTIQRSGSPKREITGRSIWHLLVFSPENAEALAPRLEALRSDWRISKQAEEIKRLLVNDTSASWTQQRSTWQACVTRLGDADYQVRQAADRQLRSGGSPGAAFLQTLDLSGLEPEQSRRVSRIIAAAAPEIDEPATIAACWVYDAEAWCCLLRDEEAETRRVAAEHLTQLLGRAMRFDAAAVAPVRWAQARVIEETLLRR